MVLAMVIVGLLMGVALSFTVALFVILSMDGRFRDNLRETALLCRDLATGRRRPAPARVIATRVPEADARIRSLQEEVRVMQRLLEDARTERAAHAGEAGQAHAEIEALRAALAEREAQVAARDAALAESGAACSRAREELAERTAELARSRREVRDLETEIGVLQSGAGLGAFSSRSTG